VNIHARPWRPVLCVLALAVAFAAVPLPALAQEPGQAAAAPGIRASIPQVTAAARLTPPRAQFAQGQQGKEQLGSTSFFKSPAGIICIAVFAAGTAFVAYSASHDRIHSLVRQSQ
jgi:hypothetical protein